MTVCSQFGTMTSAQFNGDNNAQDDPVDPSVEAATYDDYVASLEGMNKRELKDEYESLVRDFKEVGARHTTAFDNYSVSFAKYDQVFEKVAVIEEIGSSLYISEDSDVPGDLWEVFGLDMAIPAAAVGIGSSAVGVFSLFRRFKEGKAASTALQAADAALPDEAPASWYGRLFASKGFAAVGAGVGVLTAGAAMYFAISTHVAEVRLYREECPKLYRAIFENCRAATALNEAKAAMDAEIQAMIDALVDKTEYPDEDSQFARLVADLNGYQIKAGEAQALIGTARRMIDSTDPVLTPEQIAGYTGLSTGFITTMKDNPSATTRRLTSVES